MIIGNEVALMLENLDRLGLVNYQMQSSLVGRVIGVVSALERVTLHSMSRARLLKFVGQIWYYNF